MIDLEVIGSGVYYKKERHTQQTSSFWIGLYISGLLHQRIFLPDGSPREAFDSDPGPHLFWRAPGMRVDFAYGSKRENHVVMLRSSSLHYDQSSKMLLMDYGQDRIPIPFSLKILPEAVPALRRKFDEINRHWREALPSSQLAASLIVGEIFASAIAHPPKQSEAPDPAETLKQLIDADTRFEYDLAQLCEQLNYCNDYLRICFQKRYHLLPGRYRDNFRIRRIMDLISDSDLSAKEIAAQVSLKHPSHLNILLRRIYNQTPSELIRAHRFRSPG